MIDALFCEPFGMYGIRLPLLVAHCINIQLDLPTYKYVIKLLQVKLLYSKKRMIGLSFLFTIHFSYHLFKLYLLVYFFALCTVFYVCGLLSEIN